MSDEGTPLVTGRIRMSSEGGQSVRIQPVELVLIEQEYGLGCSECGCMVSDRDRHAFFMHAGRPTRVAK